MGHNHSHHNHDHTAGRSQKRLAVAAIITGCFMVAEVVGGVISGSLALIADAGHMLTDFGALVLAWAGFALSKRPASSRHNYGLDRFQILAAFLNGVTLIAVCVWITVEAVKRVFTPSEILAGPMLVVAGIGLCVNLFVFWLLLGADRDNLNINGAVLHVLGDLLGSVAAIIAALVIMKTGWVQVDPILSFLVVLLILPSAWHLVKKSGHVLLQGAPEGFDSGAATAALLKAVPELSAVTKLRVWMITPSRPIMTLEAKMAKGASPKTLQKEVREYFKESHNINDVTVELSEE